MPVESICLPVSHLPSACSFYLETLQSFGYRFVEEKDGKIGFGPDEKADLFLSQQADGPKSSTIANITFTAPSAAAIDSFAVAAVRAGGLVLAQPVLKDCKFGTYSATVTDLDGNKINATCDDPTMSTASYPPSASSSKKHDEDPAPDENVETDSPWRITVRTQTSVPPGEPSEPDSSTGQTANALVGTLLGVAAGAALTYLVGKERRSSVQDAAQAKARNAIPCSPMRQLEYPYTPHSNSPATVGDYNDYFRQRPKLTRAVTYHDGYEPFPPSPQPSPPNLRFLTQSRGAPSVSEVTTSSRGRRDPREVLMLEAPHSRTSSQSAAYRQILPPSPPSSVSSRSHHSSRSSRWRAASPSPIRSSHSKASSRRSHSVASSQRTVRPERLLLPASTASSRVSAARSSASTHHPEQLRESTRASSEASWHSAQQAVGSRKTSMVSRSPAEYALPESRKTSVVSRGSHSTSASRVPEDYPLPESRKTSVVSRDSHRSHRSHRSASSRLPEDHPLPESRKTSVVSHHSHRHSVAAHEVALPPSEVSRASASTLKPRKTSGSTTSRDPRDVPLPESRKTSVASRIPEEIPLPRSVVGSHVSSGSTLRPAKPSASALALQEDDTESLAPSDSISQISVRKHRKKHHDGDKEKRSGGHKEGKKRSVVSMPERESKKEEKKDKRGVATLLGF